ncbi:MAG: site-specific integrase [Arcicella sp.]|jgi:integrase|nr:site-specific integrase [Arcicella sp.]
MKVKYSLLFDRKNEVSTKGVGLVQIQVYLNGSRRYFSTKFYLSQKEWDIKKNSPKDPYTAKLLRERIAEFEKFEVEYTALHLKFQLSDFDLFLNPKIQEAEPVPTKVSFTDFFKNQLEKETKLKQVTLTNQKNCLIKLTEFRKVIQFEDLNRALLQDFEIFLRNVKKLRVNTIEKYHRQVRKYINLAIRDELLPHNKNPYKDYKLVTEETDAIFLLPEETERVENLVFDETMKNYLELEKARDMFLFGCYTGLRFSDCYALKPEKFKETKQGLIMTFKSIKTGKLGSRPLYLLFDGKPQAIIRKYMPQEGNKRIFNKMNNSTVNRYLKVIAEMAKVNRGLYFKASRDTFGTTLYMLSGDDKLVQKQLQHSKRDQTDKYVHLVEQIQNEGLQKIFKPSQ